ncbi:hypothetical protein Tco_0770025 [Tanacetum coccineum]|uniref:Transposase (Putative), gypsy type n=1 Tax=Tanacetum coccineum TaxID=301880 RepID=A0ABQ4ZB06_9ASTR
MSELPDDAIGDWFSFAKHRTPSPFCIDDNCSCIKHWKRGFFFIDRRAIPDAIVWRHPNAAIDDPRPVSGSFNMVDVQHLSAHVIKLRDMPEDVLVLSGLSHVWKSHVYDPVLRGANGNGMGMGFNCFVLCPWPLLLAFIVVFLFAVIGIHDFLCLPEWTGAEVQEEPYLDVRPTLQRLPFYCTPSAAAEAVIPVPTLEDLAVGTPSFKIVAKAEAFQKRKPSTSGATLSHVAKCTRSALAQSSSSTTRPSLFVGDDDESDDDTCVEIPLVTPLRSATVILSSGNQGGSFVAPTAEGSNPRDYQGKGVMVDDAVAPSASVNRTRPTSEPAPLFRNVSGDAIYMDFFPFSAGPYYATYPEDGIAGNCEFTREEWDALYRPTFRVLMKEVFKDPAICKTIVDQFPTPGEMVRVESLSDDQLTAKMSVLHCMMMSHGGELLSRYLSALKKQVFGLNDELSSSNASFAKSKAKGKERKKKIKSLTKSLDNLHTEVARLSVALNQATILEAERDEEILRLKTTPSEFSIGLLKLFLLLLKLTMPFSTRFLSMLLNLYRLSFSLNLKIICPTNIPTPRDVRVYPPIVKESTVTPASKSLELSTNVDLTASVVASKHNKKMVNAEVDGSDPKMTDDTITAKFGHAFVHGMYVSLDDAMELAGVGSRRVSSGPNDLVVALSAGEKGDGLTPSFVAGEEADVNPFRI